MRNGSRRRVVITGVGCISPIGNDVPTLWESLLSGRSGGGPITLFETTEEFATRIACEVKGFDPLSILEAKEARRYDRFATFALAAGVQAMQDAGFPDGPPSGVDLDRFGVIFGTGIGGISTLEEQSRTLLEKGPRKVSPFFIPMFIPDIAAGLLSIRFGARGPNYATVSACASSAHALGDAMRVIERGDADIMLSGGTEATITPLTIAGFASMRAMSTRNDDPARASRPFDATRDGFVIGEGAAALVLESEEHARARGARILGELAGYGASADAYHITQPVEGHAGAQIAMRAAIQDAGATPEQVDYVNAHGTSTPHNDRNEVVAIRSVFGAHADSLVVGSTKSMTGHLLGASGAVEAVVCTLVCREGVIPPTANYEHPDPDCDLDFATAGPVRKDVELAVSNSFGFGGHNVCLAIRRWSD